MAILSEECKPDNFESNNPLKLLRNFVECESFLELNSPKMLAVCETNLNDSMDSGNFSVRIYFPLIQKNSVTNMDGLADYMKEGLPFAQDLSLANSANSYLFLTYFASFSALFLFPLSITSVFMQVF